MHCGWGEVVAFKTSLFTSAGPSVYRVPDGKVLIVEHVFFCGDWWDNNPRELEFIHDFGALAGDTSLFRTNHQFGANWNQLLRPINMPAGGGVEIEKVGDPFGTPKGAVWLYGKLADESEIYARVKSDWDEARITETTIDAKVKLASSRPAALKVLAPII